MTDHRLRSRQPAVQAQDGEAPLLRLGEFLLDIQACRFMAPGGRGFGVTRLELKVLRCLMQGRGRPLSIERLMQKVYGDADNEPDFSCLRVVISTIRKKMKAAGIDNPVRCETGVGYSLHGGDTEIEVLVLDRTRLNALDEVLAFSAGQLPDAVALLRRTAGAAVAEHSR